MLSSGTHRRYVDERVAGVVVGELLLARGLEAVVELLAQSGAQLVDERTGVEAGIRAADATEEQTDVPEVRLHRGRDAGVLHLHRDRAAVVGQRAVHLPDRRRRDRLRIELGEQRSGGAPSSCSTLATARSTLIGGASCCSCDSAMRTCSGRPSSR